MTTAMERSCPLLVTNVTVTEISRDEEYYLNKLRGKNLQKGKMALLNNGNEEIVVTSERHKCRMTFSLLKASELEMKEKN